MGRICLFLNEMDRNCSARYREGQILTKLLGVIVVGKYLVFERLKDLMSVVSP